MINQTFRITPPTHLVERWRAAASNIPASSCSDPGGRRDYIDYITNQASQWGWDQHRAATESELQQARDEELEACAQWVEANFGQLPTRNLHQFRRPKPPSLKEQALARLAELEIGRISYSAGIANIRQALEALPND